MYIRNIQSLDTNNYFKCGQIVGNYLVNHKVPLLSRDGKNMIFAKTKRLQEVIDTMPFYIKIFIKDGVNND